MLSNETLELFKGISHNDLDKVERAVDDEADINAEYNGKTPIDLAFDNKNVEIIRFLIFRPNISINNENFKTRLASLTRELIVNNEFDSLRVIFELYFKKDVEFSAVDEFGKIPLEYALINKKMAEFIITNDNINIDKKSLNKCISDSGYKSQLRELIIFVIICSETAINPQKKINFIKTLMLSGFNINEQNEKGETLLHELVKVDNKPKNPLEKALKYIKILVKLSNADLEIEDCNNRTMLDIAVENGNGILVLFFLTHLDAKVNTQINVSRRITLDIALSKGFTSIAWNVLKECTDISFIRNEPYKSKYSENILVGLLNWVIYGDDIRVFKLLMENVNINLFIGYYGKLPIEMLFIHSRGFSTIAELLFKTYNDALEKEDNNNNNDIDLSFINKAEYKGKIIDLFNFLIDNGYTTLTKRFLLSLNDAEIKKYLISLAARKAEVNVIAILNDEFVNINTKDDYGNTPLITAVKNYKYSVVKKLLELGANVNYQNNEGQTALHIAVKKGSYFVKQLLDVPGIDITVKDNLQRTPLFIIVLEGNIGYDFCCELIDKYNERLNAINYDKNNDNEFVSDLIYIVKEFSDRSKTNYIQRAKNLEKLFLYVCKRGYEIFASILISAGIEVNSIETGDISPIHAAVEGGNIKIVEELLKKEADVNASCGYDKETPLHKSKSSKMTKFLLNNGAKIQPDYWGVFPNIPEDMRTNNNNFSQNIKNFRDDKNKSIASGGRYNTK